MIESFLIYFVLMCSMVALTHSANQALSLRSPNRKYVAMGFIIAAVLIFGAVFGARWDVGIDHLSYLNIYQNYRNGIEERDSLEPGFVLINKILATNDIHFFFYFFLFATVQISFIVIAFRLRKQILPFVLVVLMSGQFMGWMNIMRQETVVCVFIWLIMTIEKRCFLNYLFWILICAIFFHKSAILLTVFYPILKNRKSYTGTLSFQLCVYLISFYLGYTHFILSRLDGFGDIALLIGYDQYGDINNADVFFKEDFNWGIRSWINTAIAFVSILLSNRVKDYTTDNAFITIYNLFFWGTCCALVCTGIDVIARVFTYFSAMSLIVYGYTLYYTWKVRLVGLKSNLIFVMYGTLVLLSFAGTLYATTIPNASTRYQFFWQV